MADDKQPKIQIDSDWKAQAQAEKERLAKEAEAKRAQQQASAGQAAAAGGPAAGAAAAAGGQQMPPASFETLVQTMTAQASLALGLMADPRTGQRYLNLELAKHHIDMLSVIEEKTKGNLSEEEDRLLALTLHHLRQRFIDTVSAQREARRGDASESAG